MIGGEGIIRSRWWRGGVTVSVGQEIPAAVITPQTITNFHGVIFTLVVNPTAQALKLQGLIPRSIGRWVFFDDLDSLTILKCFSFPSWCNNALSNGGAYEFVCKCMCREYVGGCMGVSALIYIDQSDPYYKSWHRQRINNLADFLQDAQYCPLRTCRVRRWGDWSGKGLSSKSGECFYWH